MSDKEGIYYSCRKCMANSVVMTSADGKKVCGCTSDFTKQADGSCKKIQVYKAIQ